MNLKRRNLIILGVKNTVNTESDAELLRELEQLRNEKQALLTEINELESNIETLTTELEVINNRLNTI